MLIDVQVVISKMAVKLCFSQLDLEFEKTLGYDYSYVFEMLNKDETSGGEKGLVSNHDEIHEVGQSINVHLKNNL